MFFQIIQHFDLEIANCNRRNEMIGLFYQHFI